MRANSRSSFKGYEYRETVLDKVRKPTTCLSKKQVLGAAVDANEDPKVGNQNRYLDKKEMEVGFKKLFAAHRGRGPEWYGSTVRASKKLDRTLGEAMLYGRIIQILDGELAPTACAPKDRVRVMLLDARDDHRGLFNAIIPLEEKGDPNQAKTYFIERKLPGEKGLLYGPFPMPKAGLEWGDAVTDLDVYRTSPTRASFSFDANIESGWKHTVDKIQIDEERRTVTIPWRVYRPRVRSLGGGRLSYLGSEFKLGPGPWKVQMVDALTGDVLKRTRLG